MYRELWICVKDWESRVVLNYRLWSWEEGEELKEEEEEEFRSSGWGLLRRYRGETTDDMRSAWVLVCSRVRYWVDVVLCCKIVCDFIIFLMWIYYFFLILFWWDSGIGFSCGGLFFVRYEEDSWDKNCLRGDLLFWWWENFFLFDVGFLSVRTDIIEQYYGKWRWFRGKRNIIKLFVFFNFLMQMIEKFVRESFENYWTLFMD